MMLALHTVKPRTVASALAGAAQRFAAAAGQFAGECRGISAVEFALLLPVMLTLYLGGVETSQGVATDRKVELIAHTIADLTSQYTNITNADMTNILNAGAAIIAPYSSKNLQITVSEVSVDGSGNATVTWSDTLNGTALGVGSSVTVSSALAVPNTSLILAQVKYNYNPTYGYVLTGTINLSDQSFVRPRDSASISRSAT